MLFPETRAVPYFKAVFNKPFKNGPTAFMNAVGPGLIHVYPVIWP